MFEDWSVDADQADDGAGQPPGHGFGELHRRLLDVLAAHDGPAGICPSVPRLAALVGRSRRHVRRVLAELEAAGLVERVPVFERDDDLEWKRRGRRSSHPRRQTSNTYRMSGDPPDMAFPQAAGQPPGHGRGHVRPGREGTTPSLEEEGEPLPRVSSSVTVVEVGRQHPADRLNHDPTRAEVLDALAAGLGPVEVLGEWCNDQPPGQPTYTTARGRVVDLAGGPLADFHRAVDQLDRDTCLDGGCRPGRPCRRHRRRRRT
jgi:DNA-binding transcriptional ArsR family regulator